MPPDDTSSGVASIKAGNRIAFTLGIGFIVVGVCLIPVIWDWLAEATPTPKGGFDPFSLPFARFDPPIYADGTGLGIIWIGVRIIVESRTKPGTPKKRSKSSDLDEFIPPG